MTILYTPGVMPRSTRNGVVLLTALAMCLSLAPALVASGDCMPRPGCPMMSQPGQAGHCQPSESFVADCCAMQSPPADATPVSSVVVGTNAKTLIAVSTGERPSLEAPIEAVADCSPLAGKLHAIGRHTLFQSFLS